MVEIGAPSPSLEGELHPHRSESIACLRVANERAHGDALLTKLGGDDGCDVAGGAGDEDFPGQVELLG